MKEKTAQDLLMELMPKLSASAFKILKVIVRQMEEKETPEISLSNREIRALTGLSRNTVRSALRELQTRTITSREENHKFHYSLKEEILGGVRFSPGQILTSPNIDPSKNRPGKEKPVRADLRLVWHYNRLSKSSISLAPEKLEILDKFLVEKTDESGAKIYKSNFELVRIYKELLRSMRGYFHAGKEEKFEDIYADQKSVAVGSINFYAWLTGRSN